MIMHVSCKKLQIKLIRSSGAQIFLTAHPFFNYEYLRMWKSCSKCYEFNITVCLSYESSELKNITLGLRKLVIKNYYAYNN